MSKFIYNVLWIVILSSVILSQSRIEYNGKQLFLSGSNFAWVSFARDIGPGTTDFNRFEAIFKEVKAAGGNSMRLWLHTDGSDTPEFNSDDIVIGPGVGAIDDLKHILDLAQQYDVGLLLSLWSHDMLRSTNSPIILSRNTNMLVDSSAAMAYINNALIPLVDGVKGHPAIIAWEIFNEPEGITDELGWGGWDHVPIKYIQRFINWTSGAIHRTDPTAKVTNGSGNISALTDVPTLAKISPLAYLNSLTEEQKREIENWFKVKYGVSNTAKQILEEYFPSNINSFNYYTDARLISAGGDVQGILDFYTVHWYASGGKNTSPFHHSYSYWNLTKPLVVAEFFMLDSFDVPYQDLYDQLCNTGYAGAMSWQWLGDTGADDYTGNHSRTVASLTYMYRNYPQDIIINPLTGTIYSLSVSPMAIEKGDSALVKWITQTGSTVTLNDESVSDTGSLIVKPLESTFYNLVADGQIHSTKSVHLEVHHNISGVPGKYFLSQNYPNPFNPSTTIEYSIPEYSFVNLEIFNILGSKVAVLINEYKNPGNYKINFSAQNIASGIYYYRLKVYNYVKTGKMILLK